MSYRRLYSSKANTIFKNFGGFALGKSGNINTSQNPIMELRDGNSTSICLWQFDLTNLQGDLQNLPYQVKLKVFDAGTLIQPALNLKYIDLIYITDEWTEGDGYGFRQGNATEGVSNWNMRDSNNAWDFSNFTSAVYHLQRTNEDIELDVTSFISDALANNILKPTFALRVTQEQLATGTVEIISGTTGETIDQIVIDGINIIKQPVIFNTSTQFTAQQVVDEINLSSTSPNFNAFIDPLNSSRVIVQAPTGSGSEPNGWEIVTLTTGVTTVTQDFTGGVTGQAFSENIETKFIHSHHTRSIYKPYLEFKIDDQVLDYNGEFVAGQSHKLYLRSQTGSNFIGLVSAEIRQVDGTVVDTPTITNISPGLYFCEPTIGLAYANQSLQEVWLADGEVLRKRLLNIVSPNNVATSISNMRNIHFYISHKTQKITQGEVLRFFVNAEVRLGRTVVSPYFQWRLLMTNGFEMIPWQSVNIENNQMYFYVHTDFLFPNIEYEVHIRAQDNGAIEQSPLITRFTLQSDGPNHLEGFQANPYNERTFFLRGNNFQQ